MEEQLAAGGAAPRTRDEIAAWRRGLRAQARAEGKTVEFGAAYGPSIRTRAVKALAAAKNEDEVQRVMIDVARAGVPSGTRNKIRRAAHARLDELKAQRLAPKPLIITP